MSRGPITSVIGFIAFGAAFTMLSKILYQTEGKDLEGQPKLFRKPLAATSLMFAGMCLCLPMAWFQEALASRQAASRVDDRNQQALLDRTSNEDTGWTLGQASEEARHFKPVAFKDATSLVLPMAFNLSATILERIGLIYINASVFQMLRGAEIIFTVLTSVTLLNRRISRTQTSGMGCCLLGIGIVGASHLVISDGSRGQHSCASSVLFGMALVLLAQVLQAAQVTSEDFAMSRVGLSPVDLVAYEGLFGTVLMFCVILPIAQIMPGDDGDGWREDSLESFHMIFHSMPAWSIPVVLLANSLSLLLYSMSGMLVTSKRGSISHAVLGNTRTLFVWLGNPLMFYSTPSSWQLGEAWDRGSYLQAVEFAAIVAGTCIYAKDDEGTLDADFKSGVDHQQHLASHWHILAHPNRGRHVENFLRARKGLQ